MRRVEGRELRVEGQKPMVVLRASSGPRSSLLAPCPSRAGVTLIELLIVILIISILASLILGVAALAGETAREQHSKHVVERLHTLLTDYYDTYKTKRVRLNPGVESAIKTKFGGGAKVGAALAEARLYAQRETILMDIPDRWSDILLTSVETFNPSNIQQPLYLSGRTELSNIYLRQFLQIVGRQNTISGSTNTPEEIRRNQGAECLYMIIMNATGDGEARTLFGENCIGDSDGDGAPEFVDGWKHPINFLRWAPGFDSQIQIDANSLANMSAGDRGNAIFKDHDPFDLFRVDPNAYRLIPLIYSPGRNEDSGINVATDYVTWRSAKPSKINNTAPYLEPRLTPYELDASNGLAAFLGTSIHDVDPTQDETSKDNIHNHLLGKR